MYREVTHPVRISGEVGGHAVRVIHGQSHVGDHERERVARRVHDVDHVHLHGHRKWADHVAV